MPTMPILYAVCVFENYIPTGAHQPDFVTRHPQGVSVLHGFYKGVQRVGHGTWTLESPSVYADAPIPPAMVS